MAYDFAGLSPADFEDLTRDLIGRELGVRFEAFGAGPDGGMDGRNATGPGKIILQAKHYAGSRFTSLKSKMLSERTAIQRLAPDRYILATSRPVSPANKDELANIVYPWLHGVSDIFGPGDLNALLRKFPAVEKAHIKLWLTGSAVLERVLLSAVHTYTSITQEEIESKVRIYAPNPSFNEARDLLELHHVAIISGPPGVGKTTLAEMLSYAYLAEGWELVAIRSLDDGLASINDLSKQIFLFDDFLGKVALDRRALSHRDSELVRFISRVRRSPNVRFILTTRAYILEEARRVSELIADHRLQVSKYILDVGVYTREIKARILYNHLLVSETPYCHIAQLISSDVLPAIVDHKNYNPRIIEWMTDAVRIEKISPDEYPSAFLDGLDHPQALWDIAFRTHISKGCQHLLVVLFFASDYGVSINEAQMAYDSLHPLLCTKYGEPYDPKDFEEAVHILEGGFITITDQRIQFVNPSLRDYLNEYLADFSILKDCARATHNSEWASAIWVYSKAQQLTADQLNTLARSFLGVAQKFGTLPLSNLANLDRIELILDWWGCTQDERFADLALALACRPAGGLRPWRDGTDGVKLITRLRSAKDFAGLVNAAELADNLERGISEMLMEGDISSEDLESISDAIEDLDEEVLGNNIKLAVAHAIKTEFDEIDSILSNYDSGSELEDHIERLRKLSKRIIISTRVVDRAVENITERMYEIEDRTSSSESPSFKTTAGTKHGSFDDAAMRNLFQPLLEQLT